MARRDGPLAGFGSRNNGDRLVVEKHDKIELMAIRDRDLRRILERYGLATQMDAHTLTCRACAGILTWDNMGALLTKRGELSIYCNLSECIEEASKKGE